MLFRMTLCVAVAVVVVVVVVDGKPEYVQRIPNEARVPNPHQSGQLWQGVGHTNPAGSGANNQFGEDFEKAGERWTVAFCGMDSDGDGRTNGVELGDPDCTWTEGNTPNTTSGITHPGICDNPASTQCSGCALTVSMVTVLAALLIPFNNLKN